MIDETTRQAYLKAMGIQPYYPRSVLTGALPSPRYEFSEPKVSVATSANLTSDEGNNAGKREGSGAMANREAAVAPTAANARALLDESLTAKKQGSKNPARPIIEQGAAKPPRSQPAAPRQRAERPVFRSAPKDAGGSLRFDLGYVMLSEGVAVLYELPPLASAEDKRRAKTLLAAIIRACEFKNRSDGSAYDSELPHERFSWPMAEGLGLPASDKGGEAALAGFLRSRFEGDRFSELLIFGGVVEGLVGKLAKDLEVSHTLFASLAAMLSLASLKRETWADLQPVLGRIRAHSPNKN